MGWTVTAAQPQPRSRRQRLTGRALPLVVIAAGALATVVYAGARHEPEGRAIAERFMRAWAKADYDAMYATLTPDAREAVSDRRFKRAYARTAGTATLERVVPGRPVSRGDGRFAAPVRARTTRFGEIRAVV